jgi:ornithine lipid ester-linked acyl 2-hydroxylase
MAGWYQPGNKYYQQLIVPLLRLPITILEGINILFSGNQAVYDKTPFKWVQVLEQNHEVILGELQGVMKRHDKIPLFAYLSEEQKRITTGDDWRVFLLLAYGKELNENASQCPETMQLLRSITGVQSAMFSILKPGTIIRPHRGPYNGLLRYHLGLIIPHDYLNCGIKINGTPYNWRKGQSIVFDDSFEHEVWNNTSQYRVVLFVDFERPLPFPVKYLNRLFLWALAQSPFITGIVERAQAN